MKKLLSFVIVTLMIVSAVIPAFALSEAPAAPDPAENHINIWVEDGNLNITETNMVDVYVTISDNTDGFEYLKCILVYPNCLTVESLEPLGFAEEDMEDVEEKTEVEKSFYDALTDTGFDPYAVLGIDENNPEAGGKYKWLSPYFDCERSEKIDGKKVAVDCFDEGRILKITFSYDDDLNTEFGDTIPIAMYDSPDDQLHCFRKGYEWSDEPFIAVVHSGVVNIQRTAGPHVHTPGDPVKENIVPATSEKPGSYDSVVYCTGCGDELSRETVTVYANATIKVSGETIDKGDATAEFTVEVINNPGFYGTYLYFIYDKDLSFAENGFTDGGLGGIPLSPNDYASIRDVDVATYKKLDEFKADLEAAGIDYTDKQMVVVGIENSGVKNITEDGVLFKVKLNTADLEAGEYDINIVNSSINTRDVDDNPVTFDLVQGKLTVAGCEHNFTAETVDEKYLKSAADCTNPAVYYKSCTLCGASSEDDEYTFTYGEPAGHNFTAETVDDEYLVSEATCEHANIYYRSCSVCGASSEDDENTFESGELGAHDFTAEVVGDDYLAEEAKCETPAKYYRSCSVCGASSEDDTNTFEYGESAGHSYEGVTTPPECGVAGYTTYTCSKCGHSYTDDETDPLDHDFTDEVVDEKYLKSAADCTNAAVYYKSCTRCHIASTNEDDTFTNGTSLGHDFTDEVVDAKYLKSAADCTNPAVYYKSCSRCHIASETDTFNYGEPNGHDWEETGRSGSCGSIGTISYKCKNCTATKTENDTLIEHDFSLEITDEAHLKSAADCTNPAVYFKGCSKCGTVSTSDDDTFEYGEALGHEYTEQTVDEKYLKDAADCTNPAVYYKSCWRCHEASTDENDTFTNGTSLGHDFTDEVADAKYLKSAADCLNPAVYYKSCSRCHIASTSDDDTFEYGEALGHDFTDEVADAKYLKDAADCLNPAVYYKSCTRCHIASETDTFEYGEPNGHTFTDETVADDRLKSAADCTNPAVYYKSCKDCGVASTDENDTFTVGEALGHEYTEQTVDAKYLKSAADCLNAAVYYKNCWRCHEASTDENDTFTNGEALGHDFTDEVADAKYLKSEADCLNPAVYYKSCTRCHIASTNENETFTDGDALGHDFTDEVAQEKYLKTPADCTNPAVYFKSCSRCHIASETDTFNYGEPNGHTFTDEIAEPRYLKSPADCENPAVYYKSCKDCGEPSNDDALTFTVGNPLGHDYDNGEDIEIVIDPEDPDNKLSLRVCSRGDCAVDGNGIEYEIEVVEPTCTAKGYTKYLNRVTEEEIIDANSYTDPVPHNFIAGVPVPPSCTEKGYTPYTCTVGGEIENRDFVDELGHKWSDGVVTKEATATEEGEKTFTCTRCGATKTETIPKTDGSKQTGDNVMTIVFVAMIALVSGAAVIVAKKKVFDR
ncbi:MAG: hypothetical protein IJS45_09285 [Clostridia bacterium]|nr:hypothetical protein [Clostridia bacterium]